MANTKLFKALKKGFEEAIAHDQGKLELRSEFIEIPKPPVRLFVIVDKRIYHPEIHKKK